jgi:predicted acetyltransferase
MKLIRKLVQINKIVEIEMESLIENQKRKKKVTMKSKELEKLRYLLLNKMKQVINMLRKMMMRVSKTSKLILSQINSY